MYVFIIFVRNEITKFLKNKVMNYVLKYKLHRLLLYFQARPFVLLVILGYRTDDLANKFNSLE